MQRKTVGIIGVGEISQGGAPSQRAADAYPVTVARMTGAQPLIIPALPGTEDIGHLIALLDGVVLTGARPNVHPTEWGAAPTEAHEPFDQARDAVALPLVRAAVDAGLPLFGICRGMQEMSVAFGGTLHPEIRDLPGRMNHRMLRDVPREQRYDTRHPVHLTGAFARLYGADRIEVNSLHGQGIIEPGERIAVEGVAPDDTVECIRVTGTDGFALGVQWHAEHAPWEQTVNAPLWEAFRDAL